MLRGPGHRHPCIANQVVTWPGVPAITITRPPGFEAVPKRRLDGPVIHQECGYLYIAILVDHPFVDDVHVDPRTLERVHFGEGRRECECPRRRILVARPPFPACRWDRTIRMAWRGPAPRACCRDRAAHQCDRSAGASGRRTGWSRAAGSRLTSRITTPRPASTMNVFLPMTMAAAGPALSARWPRKTGAQQDDLHRRGPVAWAASGRAGDNISSARMKTVSRAFTCASFRIPR